MQFTIERKRLIKMLESVRRKLPGQKNKDKNVRLFACAARVFVDANGVTAGDEALVLAEGGCLVRLETFLALLKTYPDKSNITIQADERALRFFSTTLSVSDFTRTVAPPANFIVGGVTDDWLGGDRLKPGPSEAR